MKLPSTEFVGEQQRLSIALFLIGNDGIPRDALTHLLQSHPEYNVVGKSSVADAASLTWDPKPDVILVLGSGAGGGFIEFVQSLKARKIPVVVLVRNRYPWLVRACYTAGATGVVVVDARTVDLFGAIDAAAAHRRFLDPSLSETVLGTLSGQHTSVPRELSARESQVLKYLAYGYINAQIAKKLNVSTKSVETYRARVMEKLQLNDRIDLVRFAVMAGILAVNDLDEDIAS